VVLIRLYFMQMPALSPDLARRRHPSIASKCVFALLGFTLGGSAYAAEQAQERIEAAITDAAAQLPAEAQRALTQIDGAPRRLLALRGYLRARDRLATRWSWSQAQIEAYEKSAQYAQMLAEIDKVAKRFEEQNRGYTLFVNTQVRSLDLQLQRWNENRTVGKLAEEAFAASRAYLARQSDAAGFAQFLSNWQPSTAAPLAAPGLSLHGQLRAIDFQVHAGGRVVAGPDTSTIASVWKGQGWAQKVAAAVAPSGDKFSGPLRMPDEPWHFEYIGSAESQPRGNDTAPAGQPIRDGSES
jgi:hypothetical protein